MRIIGLHPFSKFFLVTVLYKRITRANKTENEIFLLDAEQMMGRCLKKQRMSSLEQARTSRRRINLI
jgi:hypothetical protein